MVTSKDPVAQFVMIGQERFCYRVSGGGPNCILLLHGLAETSKYFWREFIAGFEKSHTIIAIDLHGHGDSAKPARGYSTAEQAQVVASFIDALTLAKPVLLGHSLGGIIAAKLAMTFPSKISRLILYDSPLGEGFWRNITLLLRLPLKLTAATQAIMTPGLGRILFRFRTPSTMRSMLMSLRVFRDPSYFTEEMLQETVRNSYEALSQSVWHAVILEGLFRDLNRISVPTLIIRGERDIAVTQDRVDRAAKRIPDARVVTIKNASHLALIEQPAAFNREVSQFLVQDQVTSSVMVRCGSCAH